MFFKFSFFYSSMFFKFLFFYSSMFFKFLLRLMGSWVAPLLPIDSGVEPELPSNLPPMTTQPVSSSSSSPPYDVFLSFRGEDTRTNFTDHLYKALSDKGIYTFIDQELTRGEEISPALVRAIEESRISLIVFSENYASSSWCLDELVEILQCKNSKKQIVLPIFYKVDPSDVRKQKNSFGDAFKGLIQSKFKDNEEKALIWRKALTKLANLSGHTFKDREFEATFINNIVDGILRQVLRRTYWNVAEHPVGIQSHVLDVKKLLDVGGNGRRIVGIWGTSGVGKTTIAKAIWNAIAHEFEGSCFLENVRERSLVQLQKTLLHKYLGKKLKIQSVDEGIGVIKERLRHKKILLILDDVDQLEQLEKLAGDDWFGEGSRLIITTKNRRLFENRDIKLIHEVKKLDYNQALELFSWHALGRSEPPKDYLELAQCAIAFADGLPLALKILGAHLRNKGKDRWQYILDSYEGEPYTCIERILQKSYDALDHCAKEYFLDIACFFKGEKKDYVLRVVPPKFIEEFVDKALITIEWNYRILMHDLLANLGKDIVHKESPNDPGQRSRLWFYEDVKQILMESTGTRNIKGIMVELPKPAEITLNPECFRNMVNLQIFINRNASLCGHIIYLPNALRIIDWPSCQLQSLPSEFHPEHLVVFNMPAGSIRRLEKLKNLLQLTSMNLHGCRFLEKIPDLSGIPNIKYLILCECTRLVEIDDSVGLLDKLVELDLEGCVRLTRFATRLRLKSLGRLDLSNCKRLESFPEIEVEMESLRSLNITRSGVRELPSSIAYLTGLRSLVAHCSKLQLLPNLSEFRLKGCNLSKSASQPLQFSMPGSHIRQLEGFKHLPNLTSMNLRGCQFLEKIPDLSGIPNIKYLDLSHCTCLVEVDDSVGFLDKLVELDLEGCVRLTRFGTRLRLKSLGKLDLSNCKRLESFPEIEEKMESLYTLIISGSGVIELPSSIAYLTGLRSLVAHCSKLQLLPNLSEFRLKGCNLSKSASQPLEFSMPGSHIRKLEGFKHLPNLTYMNLSGCQFLEKIPDLSGIPNIKYLDLKNCTSLVEVDDSVGFLDKLYKLNLNGCVNLMRFGTRLRLKSLGELDLSNCKRLESFPEIEVEMESLWFLKMEGSGVRELPSSIAYLTGLSHLTFKGCFNLTGLELRLLYCWSTLWLLDLSGYNFVTLPECISKFVRLYELHLCDCESLLEIPQEVLPLSLHLLFLDNCISLEKIPKLPLSAKNKRLSLMNCDRLRGNDITENSILDQVSSHPHSQFHITLPGDEIPKWFSCCKDATLVKDEYSSKVVARCEVCFEIPPNLDWETLSLVLCLVNKGKAFKSKATTRVHINRKEVQRVQWLLLVGENHVALKCIPLLNLSKLRVGEELTRLQQGNMCQIIFEFNNIPTRFNIPCGVHLLGHKVADVTDDRGQRQGLLPDAMAVGDDIHDDQHQDIELLSLPSASETSLGKRPRSSDVGDREAQRGEADHPKRRHTDLNEEPMQRSSKVVYVSPKFSC